MARKTSEKGFFYTVGALNAVAFALEMLIFISDIVPNSLREYFDRFHYGVPPAASAALAFAVLGHVALLMLMYKAWVAIQDEHSRMTPSSALMRMLIPFYNAFYWNFAVFWGFARDFNDLVDRKDLPVGKLPEGPYLGYAILNLIVGLPAWAFISVSPTSISWGAAGAMALLALAAILAGAQFVIALLVVKTTCEGINALAHFDPQACTRADSGLQ